MPTPSNDQLRALKEDNIFLHRRRGELVIERDRALTELQQTTERRDKLATQVGELTGRLAAAEQREAKLRTAIDRIDSQAVCAGMDGDTGNQKMLEHIHEIAEQALAADTEKA